MIRVLEVEKGGRGMGQHLPSSEGGCTVSVCRWGAGIRRRKGGDERGIAGGGGLNVTTVDAGEGYGLEQSGHRL